MEVFRMNHFDIESATGLSKLNIKIWEPKCEPWAVMQIVHGMAEHIDRYDEFAGFFADNGIIVVGADIASHGKSRAEGGVKGYFGENDGWGSLIEDIRSIHNNITTVYDKLPCVLFGHSMGSFLTMTYASRFGNDMDGFILSGVAGSNPAIPIAKLIAKHEIKKNGATTPSNLLNSLSFGSYNKAFRPNRTDFDWLSTNEDSVDAYVKDDECGYVFTAGGFRDLFNGLSEISSARWAEKVAKKPIMIVSGDKDPVGANGKGPKQVASWLMETGHDVTLKLYEGMRHEVHNEIGRETVYMDILSFMTMYFRKD